MENIPPRKSTTIWKIVVPFLDLAEVVGNIFSQMVFFHSDSPQSKKHHLEQTKAFKHVIPQMCPTKYVIPQNVKASDWLSQATKKHACSFEGDSKPLQNDKTTPCYFPLLFSITLAV